MTRLCVKFLLDFIFADDEVMPVTPERNVSDSDQVTIATLPRVLTQHVCFLSKLVRLFLIAFETS